MRIHHGTGFKLQKILRLLNVGINDAMYDMFYINFCNNHIKIIKSLEYSITLCYRWSLYTVLLMNTPSLTMAHLWSMDN